ncbi:MAG: hypothetical protein G8345_03570 [Magnetococcales bacterium]|nr:PPC domain-containing protein [Magnetococcales bacterium]NGZ25954.1 hypothetical protein [Magnetococcales bacterium]
MSLYPETGGDTLQKAQNLGLLFGLSHGKRLINGWVGLGDSHDYYRFYLTSPNLLRLSLANVDVASDLYLYNSTGTLLLGSSLNMTSSSPALSTPLSAGTYYVRVTPYRTTLNHYTLNVQSFPVDPGSRPSESLDIGLLDENVRSYNGWLGGSDSFDYYRFATSVTGNLALKLTGISVDADLKLLDASGTLVLANSSQGGTKHELIELQVIPGTYYTMVSRKTQATDYTLWVKQPHDNGSDTPALAPNMDISVDTTSWIASTAGWVGQNDTYDYFQFIMTATGNIAMELSGLSEDADLALFNNSGSSLLATSSLKRTSADVIYRQLTPGSYQARVNRVGTSKNTSYTLSLEANDDTGGDTHLSATDLSSPEDSVTGWVGIGDSFDYYRLVVGDLGHVSLTMSGLNQDANLVLLMGSGTQTIASSMLTGTKNDTIDYQVSAGTYFARVSRTASTATEYDLNFEFEADTGSNTPSSAPDLGSERTVTGWLGMGDSYDYFRFDIQTKGDSSLLLTGADNDLGLFVFNTNGTVLVASSLTNSSYTEGLFRYYTPGTYVARATRTGNLKTDYTLYFKKQNLAGGSTSEAQDVGIISTWTGEDTYTGVGWVGTGNGYDYYKFTTSVDAEVYVRLIELTADATLEILNGDGVRILTGNKSSSSNSIYHHLTAGNYYARVGKGVSTSTEYQLKMWGSALPDGGNTFQDATPFGNVFQVIDVTLAASTSATYSFPISLGSPDETRNSSMLIRNLTGNADLNLYSASGTAGRSWQLDKREDYINLNLSSGSYTIEAINTTDVSAMVNLVYGRERINSAYVGEWDPYDTYEVYMPTVGHFEVTLNNLNGNVNLFLYNGDGQLVTSSQKSGIYNESISRQLTAGYYYIRVAQVSSQGANYTIRTNGWVETGGNTAETATIMVSCMPGWVGTGDSMDWYFLEVEVNSRLELTMQGMREDANLSLYNAATTQLISTSALKANLDESIIRQLEAGTYLVKVAAAPTQNTNYFLQIDEKPDLGTDTPFPAREMGVINSKANTFTGWLGSGTTTDDPLSWTEWVGTGDSLDFFRFTVATTGMVVITLGGLEADANLALLTGDGSVVLQTSQKTGTNDDTIFYQLGTGTHMVRVNRFASNATEYKLSLTTLPDSEGNLPSLAPVMVNNTCQAGWVGDGDLLDYYRFVSNTTGHVVLYLDGLQQNANLLLFDSSGTVQLAASNRLTGLNQDIQSIVGVGTYYAAVQRAPAVHTTYSLYYFDSDTGGDTPQTAPTLAISDEDWQTTITGWLGQGDSFDYYRFVTAMKGNLTISIDNLLADANLLLFNDSGTSTLASSSLKGTSEDSIEIQLAPGTYLVRPSRVNNLATRYDLTLFFEPDRAGETSSQANFAGNLAMGQAIYGFVGDADSVDFYRFDMAATGNASIFLSGLAADANLLLLDGMGSVTIASTNQAGSQSELIRQQLSAGSYYVAVVQGSGDTDYTLEMLAANDLGGGSTNTAGHLVINTSNREWLGVGDEEDYFEFFVNTTMGLALTLSGLSDLADLTLLDSGGTILGTGANAGTQWELISRTLPRGTYYARVNSSATNSDYTISINTFVDGGSTTATSGNLGTLSSTPITATGWLSTENTLDFYRFALSSAQRVTLDLERLADNADLQVLNGNGVELDASTLAGTAAEQVILDLAAGTYYAAVSGQQVLSDYLLTLTATASGGGLIQRNHATSASASVNNLGVLTTTPVYQHGSGQGDGYLFQIAEPGNFTFTLEDGGNLYLYQMEEKSSLSMGQLAVGSSLQVNLDVGSYRVVLRNENQGSGEYLFSIQSS